MKKTAFLEETLNSLKENSLLRELKIISGGNKERVNIKGKEVINLSSNNYLGLACHPRLQEASREATLRYGTSAASSRLIAGNMEIHRELEAELAAFKETEAALLFSSGYMANVGIISALMGKGDIIFSDKLNHASIVDGILLSQAHWKRYRHRDIKSLEELLEKYKGYKKKLIITDTVFSMDGDIAPLAELAELAKKYQSLFMVDEAHATGILGDKGKGAVEHFKLKEKVDIQMGTLSKALGGFGAFVAGRKELINYLLNKSRSFIYTTALPPGAAGAGRAALQIIAEEPQRRKDLWDKVHFFRESLKRLGFNTGMSQTQIIPLIIGDNKLAVDFGEKILEKGVYAPGIRPPTVPQGEGRIRLSLMATHSREDLEKALLAIEETGKELGIIHAQ